MLCIIAPQEIKLIDPLEGGEIVLKPGIYSTREVMNLGDKKIVEVDIGGHYINITVNQKTPYLIP